MTDKMALGIKGEITITQDGKPIYKENNTITANALEILLNSLSSVITPKSIDILILTGSFANITKPITEAIIDIPNKCITYKTRVLTTDFDGTLTSMTLNMSNGALILATKSGISVYKDLTTEIIIEWKITLNIV